MGYVRSQIHHLRIYRMFQTLPNKDRTCLEGYEQKRENINIEVILEVLTQFFYKTKLLGRNGCNPSPCPQLHQTRWNRGSRK